MNLSRRTRFRLCHNLTHEEVAEGAEAPMVTEVSAFLPATTRKSVSGSTSKAVP